MAKKGKLIVITGPSGVGKGTILTEFFKNNKSTAVYSVSMTTRSPRPSEINGINYFFVSEDEFKTAVQNNEFLEWAEYSGNLYGTNKKFVEEKLNQGLNVILEIETKGALNVMKNFPECVSVFFLPPSFEELEKRLRGRKTESEEAIQKRLDIVKLELSLAEKYKYSIVNDKVEDALSKFQAVYDYECKEAV